MSPRTIDPRLTERIAGAIADIRAGKMVILVDDEDRENEGDLTMAAQFVTPDAINFMATHGRGLICVTLTEEQIDRLELPMMQSPGRGGPPLGTAFTMSIEARQGVSTGISAADRAHTIRVAVNPNAKPEQVVTPGHVFPLKARQGGVLVRTGQTEGSVDLARLADLTPAGVICEIMKEDGTMARMPDLEAFSARFGLRILSIADLIRYRLFTESLVKRTQETIVTLDQTGSEWRAITYKTTIDMTKAVRRWSRAAFSRAAPPASLPRPHRLDHRRHLPLDPARRRPPPARDHRADRRGRPRGPRLHRPSRRRDGRAPRLDGLLAVDPHAADDERAATRVRARRPGPARPGAPRDPPAHQQPA